MEGHDDTESTVVVVGSRVMVIEPFRSDDKGKNKVQLSVGFEGIVRQVDKDGDSVIKFDNFQQRKWVLKTNLSKLRVVEKDATKAPSPKTKNDPSPENVSPVKTASETKNVKEVASESAKSLDTASSHQEAKRILAAKTAEERLRAQQAHPEWQTNIQQRLAAAEKEKRVNEKINEANEREWLLGEILGTIRSFHMEHVPTNLNKWPIEKLEYLVEHKKVLAADPESTFGKARAIETQEARHVQKAETGAKRKAEEEAPKSRRKVMAKPAAAAKAKGKADKKPPPKAKAKAAGAMKAKKAAKAR